MASFHHTPSKKTGKGRRHVLSLNFTSPEVRALAPRLDREIAALKRKFAPLVKRAKAQAKKRKARGG